MLNILTISLSIGVILLIIRVIKIKIKEKRITGVTRQKDFLYFRNDILITKKKKKQEKKARRRPFSNLNNQKIFQVIIFK